jgi:hypothetical protein
MSIGEFDRGSYWALDNALTGTGMDGKTDLLILSNCIAQEGESALYNAMDVKNYARYWHGCLAIVRPLLVLLKYKYIKYMSMILCFVLLCVAYQKISAALGAGIGVSFVVSLCMGNIVCIPFSFQYMSVYYVTILAVIFYLIRYERKRTVNAGLFFFVTGSVINYFDLLTTPAVTLGLPLVIAFLLYAKEEDYTPARGVTFIITKSVAWVLGYGLTWAFKWVIGSVILRKNVIADALDTIFYRTGTDGIDSLGRGDALLLNLEKMFPKGAIAVLALLALIWLIFIVLKRVDLGSAKKLWPVLIIAAYPFVWLMVLANHSQIHAYFTYRTLEPLLFAVFAFFASMILN